MISKLGSGFVAIVCLLCTVGVHAEEMTLYQAYEAALHQSETLASQRQDIRIADEKYRQAIGAVLPNLSGTASYLWQQDAAKSSASSSTSTSSRQPLVKLTATQPLFRGFRGYIAFKEANADSKAQSNQLLNLRLQLLKMWPNHFMRSSLMKATFRICKLKFKF